MKRRCLSLLSPAHYADGAGCLRQCSAPSRLSCATRQSFACYTSARAASTSTTRSTTPLSEVTSFKLPPLPSPTLSPPIAPAHAATESTTPAANDDSSAPFYTLGLDINTQSIGYVLLTPSLRTLRLGVISLSDLPATCTPAARLLHVTQQLTAVLSALPPHARLHTAVESYLLSFSAGGFQTRHLFQLAAWNSLVQCQLWHLSGQSDWPATVSVVTARSRFGLKGEVRDGKAGRRVSDVKAVVWQWVDDRLRREAEEGAGAATMEWRRKRDGSVHATMYDISDAYLVALTAAVERRQQQPATTEEATSRKARASGEKSGIEDEEEGEHVSGVVGEAPKLRKARRSLTLAIGSVGSGVGDPSATPRAGRRRKIALAV